MNEIVYVTADGPNADNLTCARGGITAFPPGSSVELGGVIVSATAVNYAEDAPLGSRNIEDSRQVHAMHTARMAGMFVRAGSEVSVWQGLDIEQTDITSPIPHRAHVSHDDYDIFGDKHGLGSEAMQGNTFDKVHARMRAQAAAGHTIHLVIAGPFSEAARFVEDDVIRPRLGVVAAQAGFEISQRAIYSKLAFNVDTDLLAALKVFLQHQGEMANISSDFTRHPSVTYQSAEELIRCGIDDEIGELFLRHRLLASARHKQEQIDRQNEGSNLKNYPPLSIHDLQAVMVLQERLGLESGMFEFEPIDVPRAVSNIIHVAQNLRIPDGYSPSIDMDVARDLGYRGSDMTVNGPLAPRLAVSKQDAVLYKQRVPQLLRPASHV